jgi:hypothetical protein
VRGPERQLRALSDDDRAGTGNEGASADDIRYGSEDDGTDDDGTDHYGTDHHGSKHDGTNDDRRWARSRRSAAEADGRSLIRPRRRGRFGCHPNW